MRKEGWDLETEGGYVVEVQIEDTGGDWRIEEPQGRGRPQSAGEEN
jgi:hypothetical protein